MNSKKITIIYALLSLGLTHTSISFSMQKQEFIKQLTTIFKDDKNITKEKIEFIAKRTEPKDRKEFIESAKASKEIERKNKEIEKKKKYLADISISDKIATILKIYEERDALHKKHADFQIAWFAKACKTDTCACAIQ